MKAFLRGLLPYLPTRKNLVGLFDGVGSGTRVLLGRGWAWIWADGPSDAATRTGGILLVGYSGGIGVVSLGGIYVDYVTIGAVAVWLVAAANYAPRPEEEDMDDIEEYDDEPEILDAVSVADLIRKVAARNGHQGAHLEDLMAETLLDGWKKADFKAALTDNWGLPVEPFKLVFDGKQRVRDGVRLRHLSMEPDHE